MKTRWLIPAGLAVLSAAWVPAGRAATAFDELQARYAAACEKIDQAQKDELAAAGAQYDKTLETLESVFKSRADLDGVVAIREERQRAAEAVSADPGPDVPPLLEKAREKHREAVGRIQRRRDAQWLKLTAQYIGRLDTVIKDLVKQNQIEAAVAARTARDTAKAGYAETREGLLANRPRTGERPASDGPRWRPLFPSPDELGAWKQLDSTGFTLAYENGTLSLTGHGGVIYALPAQDLAFSCDVAKLRGQNLALRAGTGGCWYNGGGVFGSSTYGPGYRLLERRADLAPWVTQPFFNLSLAVIDRSLLVFINGREAFRQVDDLADPKTFNLQMGLHGGPSRNGHAEFRNPHYLPLDNALAKKVLEPGDTLLRERLGVPPPQRMADIPEDAVSLRDARYAFVEAKGITRTHAFIRAELMGGALGTFADARERMFVEKLLAGKRSWIGLRLVDGQATWDTGQVLEPSIGVRLNIPLSAERPCVLLSRQGDYESVPDKPGAVCDGFLVKFAP